MPNLHSGSPNKYSQRKDRNFENVKKKTQNVSQVTIAQFVIPLMVAAFANAAIYRKLKVKICEACVFEILVVRS